MVGCVTQEDNERSDRPMLLCQVATDEKILNTLLILILLCMSDGRQRGIFYFH